MIVVFAVLAFVITANQLAGLSFSGQVDPISSALMLLVIYLTIHSMSLLFAFLIHLILPRSVYQTIYVVLALAILVLVAKWYSFGPGINIFMAYGLGISVAAIDFVGVHRFEWWPLRPSPEV